MTSRVLVTGGAGFIGSQVVARLAAESAVERVVAVDLRAGTPSDKVRWVEMDVRDAGLVGLLIEERVEAIIHLAAVVSPGPHQTRELLFSIEVEGTRNVVTAALEGQVRHLTVTSSGAAYGYHPDNPEWIDEDQPLRGNPGFAYSDHKRLVEADLARTRANHPELSQLILRPGTVLGETVDNQITALFDRSVILGIAGSPTPFVFIWDTDVVEIIVRGALEQRTGVFNLAGSGAVPLRQIAVELGKPFVPIPASLVKIALAGLKTLRMTRYGPEQVDFLRYRPVLSNKRLVEVFGYEPALTSLEALRAWRDAHD